MKYNELLIDSRLRGNDDRFSGRWKLRLNRIPAYAVVRRIGMTISFLMLHAYNGHEAFKVKYNELLIDSRLRGNDDRFSGRWKLRLNRIPAKLTGPH